MKEHVNPRTCTFLTKQYFRGGRSAATKGYT
jgi:hypothetical protein